MSFSDLRHPKAVVLADGTPVPGVISAQVTDNSHFSAARFAVKMAIDYATFAQIASPTSIFDVQFGLDAFSTSMIQGRADHCSIDAVNRTIEIEGRDLTARLIDARTQETFSNRTASEIVEILANRRGFIPSITNTTNICGRYFDGDHERAALNQYSKFTNEWDLLVFLASNQGFDVYITGNTLNFHPPPTDFPVYTLTPQACITLRLEHNLAVERDVEVVVQSWNSNQQLSVSESAQIAGQTSANSGTQRIVVVKPNLSASDARDLGRRILADLSGHRRIVSAELPGELILSSRSRVSLANTNTDFDGIYQISEIDRHIDAVHGFTERLRLKMPPVSG